MSTDHEGWVQYRSPLSAMFSTRHIRLAPPHIVVASSEKADAVPLLTLGPLRESAAGVVRGGVGSQAYAFYVQSAAAGVVHVFATHDPRALKTWLTVLTRAGVAYHGIVDALPETSPAPSYAPPPSARVQAERTPSPLAQAVPAQPAASAAVVPPNSIPSVMSSTMTMAVLVNPDAIKPNVKMVSRYFVLTPPVLTVYSSSKLPARRISQITVADYQVGFKHFADSAPNCVYLAPLDLEGTAAEAVIWLNTASADKQRGWVRALIGQGKAKAALWDDVAPMVEGTLFYEYLLAPPPPLDAKVRPISTHSRYTDVNDARKEARARKAAEAEAAAIAATRPASADHSAALAPPPSSSSAAGASSASTPKLSVAMVVRMKALASKVPVSVKERAAQTRKWCDAIVRARSPSPASWPTGPELNMEKGAACGWLLFEMVAHYAGERPPPHTIDVHSIAACRTNVSLAREWMGDLGIDVDGWEVDDVVGCSTRPLLRALAALAARYNVDVSDPGTGYAARAPRTAASSSSAAKRALRSSYTPDVQRAVPATVRHAPYQFEPSLSPKQQTTAAKLEKITLPWANAVLDAVGSPARITLATGDGLATGVGLVYLLTLGVGNPLPAGLDKAPATAFAAVDNLTLAYSIGANELGAPVVAKWPDKTAVAAGRPLRKALGILLGSVMKGLRGRTILDA